MKHKRFLGWVILLGYIFSQLLSYLGYVDWGVAYATDNTSDDAQIVAVLVDDDIYSSVESDIKRYATKYIQKKYPQSKALVLRINKKEYSAPEITKLLENMYFDGIKDKSSRMIGVVLVGDIPLPVVKYDDYIFPSVYPYVDFLEQKYIWNQSNGYFIKNQANGQAEIWHGIINFGTDTKAYSDFFQKLKTYDKSPKDFVQKKIWYDDFIALKNNFLAEEYKGYQKKLAFAEDLMYHRYTDFFVNILQGSVNKNNSEILDSLSKSLDQLGMDSSDASSSLSMLSKSTTDHTPTKLIEQKIYSFLRDYYNSISIPLLHTISENVKASDRWELSEGHHQKIQIKDKFLLGDKKASGFFKQVNDKLEDFVDQKIEKERYAMHLVVPTYYHRRKDEKKKIFFKEYYIPVIKDTFLFFFFGKDALTIANAKDFSIFRGSYRNLLDFVKYSDIIDDLYNPAKTKEDDTNLYKKGVGASYDSFSTQVESNRGFNVLNIENEYKLYEQKKQHAEVKYHCTRRWFGLELSWKWVPCAKVERAPVGKCNPNSKDSEDHANCENFQQFGQRVWGGATPLNIDSEKMQNQIYAFSGKYTPESAWRPIFDIAGSVALKSPVYPGMTFESMREYISPTQIEQREGPYKDPIHHNLTLRSSNIDSIIHMVPESNSLQYQWGKKTDISNVDFLKVDLSDKKLIPNGNKSFSLLKPKRFKEDLEEKFKYKIIDSKIFHKSPTMEEINGYSGSKDYKNDESTAYYSVIMESFGDPELGYASGFLSKLQMIKSEVGKLKSDFNAARGSDDPDKIKSLIPDSFVEKVKKSTLDQNVIWEEFNSRLGLDYPSNISSVIDSILLRQISGNALLKLLRKEKIGMFDFQYKKIIDQFGALKSYLNELIVTAGNIFNTFSEIISSVHDIDSLIEEQKALNQGTGHQEVVLKAWETLNSPLNNLKTVLKNLNDEKGCNAHQAMLGLLLNRIQKVSFVDNVSCSHISSSDSDFDALYILNMRQRLEELKKTFLTNFYPKSIKDGQADVPGMNILTSDRPIDSPRYVSFQGVGGNPIQLIYPNLFKVEMYNELKGGLVLKKIDDDQNQVRESLIKYLKDKVKEYNKILENEKKKAQKMNEHYIKLGLVNKLATPTLDPSVRPYAPFTYQEILDAIGGQKMLDTLSELLYYQSITNPYKDRQDDIKKDLNATLMDIDVNQKISYVMKNYLSQKNDIYLKEKKNTYPQLVTPNYNATGYEVGYINSDENDYVEPDIIDENLDAFTGNLTKDYTQYTSMDHSEEVKSIEKECGFDFHEALLLYNFQTKNYDWYDGFKCWLKQVKKKPFELKLSFDSDFTALKDKNALSGFIYWDAKTNGEEAKTPRMKDFFEETQFTITNKKVNILNKTGAINLLSLEDFQNSHIMVSSTGENCLLVNGSNTCKGAQSIYGNSFKKGLKIPFKLAYNKTGNITIKLKICLSNGECGVKNLLVSAVPGPLSKIEITLPPSQKVLAGAYNLFSVMAFDKYKNRVLRTIDPYTIEVDKGYFLVGGKKQKSQEITDFEKAELIYGSDTRDSGVVRFKIKDKKNKVLSVHTLNLVRGNLFLEQNHKRISSLEYTVGTGNRYQKNNSKKLIINEHRLLPIDITIKDIAKNDLKITTNLIITAKKGLAKVYLPVFSKNNGSDNDIELLETSSLLIDNGKVRVYVDPGYVAGDEILSFIIPGLPEKTIPLRIKNGDLSNIKISVDKTLLDKKSKGKGEIILTDARGNKVLQDTSLSLSTFGSIGIQPHGKIVVKNGNQNFNFTSSERSGIGYLIAKTISHTPVITAQEKIITKEFFLEGAINSGLNIMYLNLFGNDRGNQRGYFSANKKISEDIITKSEKTLAITTSLIDPKNIKKTAILFGENGNLENMDHLPLTIKLNQNRLSVDVKSIGTINLHQKLETIKTVRKYTNKKELLKLFKDEKSRSLFIYDLKPDYTYKQMKFFTKEGTLLGDFQKDVVLEWSPEIEAGNMVWYLSLRGQKLGKAILANIDFSDSEANIQNKKYKFGIIFAHGSTNYVSKALFNIEKTLSETYDGYDSIQNSDNVDKYIGFRAKFKNITYFAGGKTVGESTIPFGSEFLINIGDPLLKRVDKNSNFDPIEYNQGLGKQVYSDTTKEIFKTLDIDYNGDGLRDLIIVYQDGTIKLQKQSEDKSFHDMGTLMVTAEQIKDVFVGDVDGDHFEDIIIRTASDQLRIYFNSNGIFDVDGNIACLNTDVKLGDVSKTPEKITNVHQLFLNDMDKDGKLDIITLDVKGYLKIFYGANNKDNHSYVSKDVYKCDADWYNRQSKSTKIVKKFGLQLSASPIRDDSLIRWTNLKYPSDDELTAEIMNKKNSDLGISIETNLLSKWKSGNFQDKNKDGKIDKADEAEIFGASKNIDFVDMASEGVDVLDKYRRNPFEKILNFDDNLSDKEQAFLPARNIGAEYPVDVYKTYFDLNGGNLENGDKVRVNVTIKNKYAFFSSGSAFFDRIQGPWMLSHDKYGLPDITFEQGFGSVKSKINSYAYYITDFKFSASGLIRYSYDLTYVMKYPLFKLSIEDVEIGDFKKNAPQDGYHKDGLDDVIIQSSDSCNKKQSILFNNHAHKNRDYREAIIDVQALADELIQQIEINQAKAKAELEKSISENKSSDKISQLGGMNAIQETMDNHDIFGELWENLKNGNWDLGAVNVELFSDELKKVEKTVQNVADGLCNGFSLGMDSAQSCGLPIPFNQAFLAPGKYHLMGCIPIAPLTNTLGKGIPIFNFPGTLVTPVGPVPIPRGLKGPGDSFLRPGGGTYPSRIRIYAAPTLTAQLGLAICFGPQNAMLKLPSPLSDIAGNCIVVSLPSICKNKSSKQREDGKEDQVYYGWSKDYKDTGICSQNNKNTPFKMVASNISNSDNINEIDFLGGSVNINYDYRSHTASDSPEFDFSFNGVNIEGVKDIKNKILGGKDQGIHKMLVGWFDRQVQYWINNLLRFRVEFIFPDMEHMSKQISSFNLKDLSHLTSDSLKEVNKELSTFKEKNLTNLTKSHKNLLASKEQIASLDLMNGDNPFEKLKDFFNDKELVSLSTQKINVKVPWIYSEDIESYKNYLLTWEENNKQILDARSGAIHSYGGCKDEIDKLTHKDAKSKANSAKENANKDCKAIQQAEKDIMKIISKFDKTSEQIYQNIQILELYKRFPLQLYEWMHVTDKYLGDISALLSNFFGYINYWMDVNASRFSQYIDAVISIIGVVKTYQVLVDLFVDRGKKCGKCSEDSYDQYACKLSLFCKDFPIIPIPSVKIPSLYIDLSHFNLGMDIVLPKFNFVPDSIELPQLPNLPEPPAINSHIKVDFNIPDIPLLPEPPELQELPSLIPHVKMQLPILPPAPKIPELPNKISAMINLAKQASKILCIIKKGIGLVGENSVKARIEQMTQRNYRIPWVDNMDLTLQIKQTPLQGIDIQVDSYVNLQYNFDAFYSLLKGLVDNINQTSYSIISSTQNISDTASNIINSQSDHQDNVSNPVNINVNIGYKNKIKNQILDFQKNNLKTNEKERFAPILSLLSTDNEIKKNEGGISSIHSEISKLIASHKSDNEETALLAKTDYDAFLDSLKSSVKNKPLHLTYSTSLLEKNKAFESAIPRINPTQVVVDTESKRLNGYINALNSNTPLALNMSIETYQKSQRYLANIQEKLAQWNTLKQMHYAGNESLKYKNGGMESRTLLTQTHSRKPKNIQASTTDLSSYINGVLIKRKNRYVNSVYSKYNYEQFREYYEKDINNDNKADIITWDKNSVYIKYADDEVGNQYQKYFGYYQVTPTLKNKEKKYENFNSGFLKSKEEIKLYDKNDEIKNFKMSGQTFDALVFSWHNNKDNIIDAYLIRISDSIDGLLTKREISKAKYALLLPLRTDIKDKKLIIDGKEKTIQSWIDEQKIIELAYYHPAKDTIQFNLSKVPRKWQYIQITSLQLLDKRYERHAPWSNQLVAGRQIIGDDEPPKAKIELIRVKKNLAVDEGVSLRGYIGSYYDINVTRTDNVELHKASIKNDKETTTKVFNAQKGVMKIQNLFFSKETEQHYTILAEDSQGNKTEQEIVLKIDIPKITIENIQQQSGWKEGIKNPILISSRLETDIDQGDVNFERKRKGEIATLTAIKNGKKHQTYHVSTNQTLVEGAYYDFGELIGLYDQTKNLLGTVNGKNGEIKIKAEYQRDMRLGVDFSQGYPYVKLIHKDIPSFEIRLQPEKLIKKQIYKGVLIPLKGEHYGPFNGGEALMMGKEVLLYISPTGLLWTDKPLRGEYSFDQRNELVKYDIFENAFGEKIATITFKTKAI